MILTIFVSLLIIIVLHEGGHLLAALLCGCRVEEFSIGFGEPILFETKIKGIKFTFRLLLLGGECKLGGELHETCHTDDFLNLGYTKKVIIALAGIVVNIITGLVAWNWGLHIGNETLALFGYFSTFLALFNALPIFPCLDGGYLVWLPYLVNKYGWEAGVVKFAKYVRRSFVFLMATNIICIPWAIYYLGNWTWLVIGLFLLVFALSWKSYLQKLSQFYNDCVYYYCKWTKKI
jgi:hypothetical protein